MTDKALILFKSSLSQLSKNESLVLNLLIDAGKLIVPLYSEQENHLNSGISKEEIEKLAKKDSSFASPFTVVEKIDGKFKAIPYHIKYAKLLSPIADKLVEASRITDNKEFSGFLSLQAKALIDGSYEQALAVGLKMKPYILDISIGPLYYFNRLSPGKAVYQSWVGILDIDGTRRLNDYKVVVFNAQRKQLVPNERIDQVDHIKAKTIDEVLLSGFMARSRFVGLNLPMDVNLVEKYGSEVTIFNQTNNLRLKEQIMPTFKKVFSSGFKKGFNMEDLRRGSLRYVALHELAHGYLYYRNSVKNLDDLFPVIYELTATLLGMRIAGSLLLKDKITTKQLESMIVAFTCRSYDLIEKSTKNKFMLSYAQGGAIFINYMLESGSIKQQGGMAIANFMKIFLSLNELSYVMERLLSSGTRVEAEIFIKKYGQIK